MGDLYNDLPNDVKKIIKHYSIEKFYIRDSRTNEVLIKLELGMGLKKASKWRPGLSRGFFIYHNSKNLGYISHVESYGTNSKVQFYSGGFTLYITHVIDQIDERSYCGSIHLEVENYNL